MFSCFIISQASGKATFPDKRMLQWSGVDIKTAQELMGHSEYGVTANIYTHVDEATKTNAAMLQDKFIKETLIS